jgi:purine-binding chemotaxis protein CheW
VAPRAIPAKVAPAGPTVHTTERGNGSVRTPAAPATARPVAPTRQVRVTLEKPAGIEARQAVSFLVQVSNTGTLPIDDVQLRLGAGAEWVLADQATAGVPLGRLAPGAKKRVRVCAVPRIGGKLQLPCSLTGKDGFLGSGSFNVSVLDRALHVKLTLPENGCLGADVDGCVHLTNPAAEAAGPLSVHALIPEGVELVLLSERGSYDPRLRTLSWRVGQLPGGATLPLNLRVRPEVPGTLVFRVTGQTADREVLPAEATLAVPLDPKRTDDSLENLVADIDGSVLHAVKVEGHRLQRPAAVLPEVGTVDRYVFFSAGELDCAVPLAGVLELRQPHGITPVPNVPDWVLGVANVRGDIVSMVDLGRFLNVPPGSGGAQRQVLVVRAQREDVTTGLIVDRVRGIRTVARDRLSSADAAALGNVGAWVGAIARFDDRPAYLLDLERLLLSSEMRL